MSKQVNKKENFNKAVFDMFGVGGVQVVTEDAPEMEAPVAEQGLSAEVQTAEVAAPNAAHAAPYSLIPATFLAPGTALEGKLKSKGDVEIAGSFSGEIEADGNVTLRADATCNIVATSLNVVSCHLSGDCNVSGSITVSENSAISGNVTGDEFHCSGTITGDIVVKNGLSLESTARVYGNIVAGTISMSRGAVIKGTVSMENA